MDEMAIGTSDAKTEPATPPGFGILLSLLAIGLTLTMIRGFGSVVALNSGTPDAQADRVEHVLMIGSGLLGMVALVLLLRRKRVFIPVMATFLVINFVLSLALYILVLTSGVTVPNRGMLHLAMFGSVVIAGLWLSYLWRSKHLRKVCIN